MEVSTIVVLIIGYLIYDYYYKSDKPKRKRKPISQSVKDKVWRRDSGKCVECGSNEKIEFDHINLWPVPCLPKSVYVPPSWPLTIPGSDLVISLE